MSIPTGLPYTPAVRAGDWLIVSGQIGLGDGGIVSGGAGPELAQALANLRTRLLEHGADMGDVVKTTVFLVDMEDYGVMNEVYAPAFDDPRPARSAVAVAALPFGARIEIEAWAWLGA